ncbi:ABC-2 type transport system permease protein/ribosome-dependent ATPase [Desulfurobacterium atlanticum]|uniref:ABC-2 type transport system permease protein/ribosome-dependent ATPase n=2 Tax=Desulfurobacterium atlanticum TaxID=240169 RepID=A0A238Y701_9BACT|nr:ABC-2 type transport system permease protein/ribosome-dependent ATPase [Desulfurobacterium atlanticum]
MQWGVMNFKKIKTIILKEFKEMLKDKIGALVIFIVPISTMLIFGYGMRLDVDKIPFVVVDRDHSSLSRELIYRLSATKEYFKFVGEVSSEKVIDEMILKDKARFGVVIPENFERDIKRGKNRKILILIDATFPYRGEMAKSYVVAVVNQLNLERIGKLGKVSVPVELKTRYWFNESLKQEYLMAAGTMAIVLFMSPAIVASLLIAKERERGSIYNIYTSSITPLEYLLGKLLYTFCISFINFLIIFLLTLYLFKVPFKGNIFLFVLASSIFIAVSSAFGLFLSTFLRTQVSAFVGSIILTIVPSVLYSGYMTPISAMNKSGLFMAYMIPTFYYMKILKGCFFKNTGFTVIFPYITALSGFFLLFFGLNVKLFKKRER